MALAWKLHGEGVSMVRAAWPLGTGCLTVAGVVQSRIQALAMNQIENVLSPWLGCGLSASHMCVVCPGPLPARGHDGP